ncbi:hypothetical protein [Spiroplasma turonicum]|uniref:Uncharacterized protein n=1 Tax=Spiroplasma turonicum TaxID=216946 RepID=A0A0K1P607_9MOLU|nr:hypothetical protein [Spiroplasma turonicum]AKU79609.1 hypothetical protein STURON_00363 [Spiroplasma turonicum]ALX70631.1 hypothetical protein STURO_v1c03630 [Spiroplasma turonicum]
MKKEMIYLSIQEFIQANLDFNIASNRKESEYDFNFTRWKTIIFSSQKLKFILKYTQSVFQWLSKVVNIQNFNVSIDTTTVDRFNLSIYEFDRHVFNCSLFTNFYLIEEEDWSTKVFEMHFSKYDLINGEINLKELTSFWKGEEGFEKFVNVLYAIMKEPYKYEKVSPIQWQIDFKDKKISSSQIRMQLASLVQTGIRPQDPYLTIEQAELIEKGASPQAIATKSKEESESKDVINPLWDEAIEQENLYKDLEFAMRKSRGLDQKKVKRKRR